jgi:hypothetical protein
MKKAAIVLLLLGFTIFSCGRYTVHHVNDVVCDGNDVTYKVLNWQGGWKSSSATAETSQFPLFKFVLGLIAVVAGAFCIWAFLKINAEREKWRDRYMQQVQREPMPQEWGDGYMIRELQNELQNERDEWKRKYLKSHELALKLMRENRSFFEENYKIKDKNRRLKRFIGRRFYNSFRAHDRRAHHLYAALSSQPHNFRMEDKAKIETESSLVGIAVG